MRFQWAGAPFPVQRACARLMTECSGEPRRHNGTVADSLSSFGPTWKTIVGGGYDAILFDLDGVLTDTAAMHEAAWKVTFDEFLRRRAEENNETFAPFEQDDYLRFVDGRPRMEGVSAFLASRGIRLPEGDFDVEPSMATVGGLGNTKNEMLGRLLDAGGVSPLPGAVSFVTKARRCGMRTAVVSSSANASGVLSAAGLDYLFDARVDGVVARRLGLAGKPAPDTFLEAARLLDVAPSRAIVVEDALVGVRAGRTGGFGLVIGIAPPKEAASLRAHGADVVVGGLADLVPD